MRIPTERISEQLVKLLSDSRIHPDQWRYWIPQHITEENMHIISNAKNFADGINEQLDELEIRLPAHLVVDYLTRHEADR